MTVSARFNGIQALAIGLTFAASMALAPVSAQAGFLDQFFGGNAPQPAQPSYAPEPSMQPMSPDQGAPVTAPRLKRKVVVRQVTPVLQKTTDLMHDKTLRPGDAIMMKDGVHVYNGPEAIKHSAKEFVPIEDARYVSSTQRAALVAMDTTHSDPLASLRTPNMLASGRSAAVDAPVVKGFKITDARGASIRYVGP